ncbi:hypothetical protein BJ741DRAFT_575003 [Chytriomyces cf. hyalinus JEL632]|nr:hypothetical protein BJ741DRAFT_575003 [Chytriomyces cf. hyalinus JEL632]
MITSIPVEIQQLVLIKLPVDKNLVNAPCLSEDMAFVQLHMHTAVDRNEAVFSDWMHMPPLHQAASLSQELYWRNPIRKLGVIHGLITASVPQPSSYNHINTDAQLTPHMGSSKWSCGMADVNLLDSPPNNQNRKKSGDSHATCDCLQRRTCQLTSGSLMIEMHASLLRYADVFTDLASTSDCCRTTATEETHVGAPINKK